MNRLDWKSYAETLGIAAIVASLVFVGLELRQSHQIALAAQYQARTDSGRQYFYESLDSEYRINGIAGDIATWEWPDGFLSAQEKQWLDEQPPAILGEASYWATINLYGFDNYYYQYQSGFLSEEGWLALQARLSDMLNSDPLSRHLIVFSGSTFRQSFVELARSLIEEPDSTPMQTRIDSVVEGTKSLEGAACKNGNVVSCLRIAGLTCDRSVGLRSRVVCSSDEQPVYSINNDVFDMLPYELPEEWAIEVLND